MPIITHYFFPKELFYFLIMGTLATIIDWFLFYLFVNCFGFYYQLGLVLATTIAGITHYATNKWFTFNCQSKQVASQLSMYILIAIITMLCSMGIMAILVQSFAIDSLILRMVTTIIMILPNYFLHKYFTFNKRLFMQPKPS